MTHDSNRIAALTSLIDTTREVMWAAGTTEVSDDDVHEAERLLAQAAVILVRVARDRVHRTPVTPEWAELARTGEPVQMAWLNPLRIPVEVLISGRRGTATLVPGALHEGPQGCLHGGFSAAILDHLLGVLLSALGMPAFTASLTLSYHRPTLLDLPAEFGGELVSVDGRKIGTRAWIHQDGVDTVTGEGLFIVPAGLHIDGLTRVTEFEV